MHLFYVSHDYMGTWTLTLPSTKTGSMMPKSRKMCSGTHRVHSHLRESWNQTKLEEVSSLNIHIRQTSGCEPLSVAFSCMILVIPGLYDFWASMGLTHHLVVFGHAFSWAPKVGAKNKSIGLCIHNVATNSEGLSVQLELWFQTQTEVNSALRPCLVLLNCISHHWIITVLCELPLLHIPRSASLSHS